MFKRIHSNRDPGTTVYSEIRREFAVYLTKIRRAGQAFIKAHPRTTFVTMLVSLIASGVLCFTIERNHEPPKPSPKFSPGISKLESTLAAIHWTMRIRNEVDSLATKEKLSHQDSLILENDLDSLSQFNKKFKP